MSTAPAAPAVWQFLGVLGIGGRYYRSIYVEGYRLLAVEDYAEAEQNTSNNGACDRGWAQSQWDNQGDQDGTYPLDGHSASESWWLGQREWT